MEDLPVDARRVVDELRAIRQAQGASPRSWVPSATFDEVLVLDATLPRVVENEHLEWLHRNWHLAGFLAPPPGRGLKGLAKRLQHRLIMAVLGPYLSRLQDLIGANVRAIDTVTKRADVLTTNQLRTISAVRHDLVDFAHAVEKRLDG